MKDKEFMNQKASSMNVKELVNALKIKIKQNMIRPKTKIKLKSEQKIDERVMVCCVCGNIDESRVAFCDRCGRTTHRLMSKESQKKFREMLIELK